MFSSVLHGLGFPDLDNDSQLHLNYASQLEMEGLWDWAIYVAMHIKEDELRERAVRDILWRHYREDDSQANRYRSFLADRLHVPSSMLAAAVAWRLQQRPPQQEDMAALPGKAVTALAEAGLVDFAHQTALSHAPAIALLPYSNRLMEGLFVPLSDHSQQISNWQSGGQVFLEFAKMTDALPSLLQRLEARVCLIL